MGKLAPPEFSYHNVRRCVLLEGIVARQVAGKKKGAGTGRRWPVILLALALLVVDGLSMIRPEAAWAQDLLTIGQIQGRTTESSYEDRAVRFRGIVTGMLEDQNARGTRFYTVFVQDVPGSQDGDPLTSDGLAIFAGARRPGLAVGDIAIISGYVTEFYGLTELDNNDLAFWIESRNNALPEPAVLEPPSDNARAAEYLERFEGMLVAIPAGTVVGPSHPGCGFSLVRQESGISRVLVHTGDDPAGHIISALHPSDVNCEAMPAATTGDTIEGLSGPLTYHFERFKIVYQDADALTHRPAERPEPLRPRARQAGQLMVATFNVNDYFDAVDDGNGDAELKPSPAELALKRAKLAATIAEVLNCPDVLGVQEAENETLLDELAVSLAGSCGFVYQVSHRDGPDGRGADVALLSNPGRVSVVSVDSRQSCTELETGLVDPNMDCPAGQAPLHARPPLQVEIVADGQRFVLLVNHFKSKRGGAQETAAWRLAQANHVRAIAEGLAQSPETGQVIVMGDFNDYDGSTVMHELVAQDTLVDSLRSVPPAERYSYIFDGASQLIDWILVSPALADRVQEAGIVHSNADYPVQMGLSADPATLALRSSDHDVPYVVISTTTTETPAPPRMPAPTTRATPNQPRVRSTMVGGTSNAGHGGRMEKTVDATIALATEPRPEASRENVGRKPPATPTVNTSPVGVPGRAAELLVPIGLLLLGGLALLLAAAIKGRRR